MIIAKVGDKIRITDAMYSAGMYKDGDILTVNTLCMDYVTTDEVEIIVFHEEYTVINEGGGK